MLEFANFNSHAHVERDYLLDNRFRKTWNFNSHAHVERDISQMNIMNAYDISTHTLTWSVTCRYPRNQALSAISTHTLTWSVT